jgi:alkaline phosphatase D
VPAAGCAFQRWFEPARPLPNPGPTPYTGDITDAFGNRLRVLAVANPSVTFQQFRAAYPGNKQVLGDQTLKPDGYGIVRVDKLNRRFVLECWPWNVDPTTPGARQRPGWPYTVAYDAA